MKAKSGLILAIVLIITAGLSAIAYFGVGEKQLLGIQNIRLGLDLKGGVNIVYEADADKPTDAEMNAAVALIRQRLDNENYTEAEVSRQGEKRIRVDIPGVKDANKAVKDIGATAQLKFVDPDGKVVVTGANVKEASKQIGTQNGRTQAFVSLKFDAEGTKKFAEATARLKGQQIAIQLDDVVISAPSVNAVINDGNAMIEGGFTPDTAEKLASRIKAGALPFNLTPLQTQGVGAKLGIDAMDTSILAGMIGIACVMAFMLVVYRVSGLAADLALVFYIATVFVIYSGMSATLTLPGIAGMILSVGMAVDANVIIFARIKEELALGKTIRASIDSGFKKAFSAILDGNVTTLIASGVLYWLGTGLIKSFAQTLAIGILVSMFTALVVTRILLKQFVNLGLKNPKLYGAK